MGLPSFLQLRWTFRKHFLDVEILSVWARFRYHPTGQIKSHSLVKVIRHTRKAGSRNMFGKFLLISKKFRRLAVHLDINKKLPAAPRVHAGDVKELRWHWVV